MTMRLSHVPSRPSTALLILRSLALLITLGASSLMAQTPPAAQQVMDKIKVEAASQHKDIFLTFRASWCTPCKLLEAFVAAPEIHPILDKYFVFADLNIYEENYKKPQLNSPGSEDLVNKFGGKGNGVPFIVFLNSAGEPIVNSVRIDKGKPADNIGYPVLPEEIDWFMAMLAKAAPSLPKTDAQPIDRWLRDKAKSIQLPPH